MTYRSITTNQGSFNSAEYDIDRITRILTASVLGDGGLVLPKKGKNALYVTSKTVGHEDYLNWIRSVIELIVPTKTYTKAEHRHTVHPTCINKAADRLQSRTHPLLTSLHSLIYHDRKKLAPENLELDAEMIAILLQDDGNRNARDGHIKISTDGFSLASVEILQEQFEAVTELHWTVFKQGNLKDGTPAYNLRLARRHMADLAIMLKPYTFPSYYHKLGLELDGITPIPLKMRSI